MKVTITKSELLALLGRVKTAANPKGSHPLLGCVLLDAGDNWLNARCTDLYLDLDSRSVADVSIDGSVCVLVKELYDRVKAMPAGPIELNAAPGERLTINAAGCSRKFRLNIADHNAFPPLFFASGTVV